MSGLGDRHAGDADGAIKPAAEVLARSVVVTIDPAVATRTDVQHAATLVINLLSRSADYVTSIRLDCPDVPLQPRVVPPGLRAGATLRQALVTIARAVGDDAVPLTTQDQADELSLAVGPGPAPSDGWRLHGTRWRGVATRSEVPDAGQSDLPIGPYVAACLAAAAVCWEIRGKSWHGDHLEISAWDLSATDNPTSPCASGPANASVELDALLAGIGAVGTAFLLTLWACPDLGGAVAAADDDEVDDTNRNRCVLFFARDVDEAKATVINRVFDPDRLRITAVRSRAETLIVSTTNLVSAVDRPESRDALQQRYPASIIQASTNNVRVELLRCDPSIPTACLRCYNPPRPVQSDDALRQEFAALDESEIQVRADALGTDLETLKDWIDTGRCSEVTGRLLAQFRSDPDRDPAFAIGFASTLAGVLLAAQAIKDAHRRNGVVTGPQPPLFGALSRARYSLLNLGAYATGAAAYGRDPSCPACREGTTATTIWRRRFRG